MKNVLLFLFVCLVTMAKAQIVQDSDGIKEIFDAALKNGKSYEMLTELCTKIGPRLSGSPGAAAAVEWSRHMMEKYDFDSVWLQPVMVPHWVRGEKEIARVLNSKKMGMVNLTICALGGSPGTGPSGISSQVIEVKNFDELKQLGSKVQGKIIFFNRPMDPTKISTFAAYGGAVDQRGTGAVEAAKLGASAVIVRSMGVNLEDYPHTGGVRYSSEVKKIPAVAVSTKHAELLSQLLKEEKDLQVYLETHCEILDDAPSSNVIGQINGSEFKNEIIDIGGHLDSWDLAQGAHDDGAGVVQSIEVLRLFKQLGIKPKRTIRAVMFMNEENGLRGGTKYAETAKAKNENHIVAIESDEGGFTPRGFTMTATDLVKNKIKSWKPLFEPYGLTDFDHPGGGADIGPLGALGTPMIGYLPDSQRYFDYHHTPEDTIDKVSPRELELGAAAMASLVFLIDRYSLK
ncbi:MAG: M20/M25/M40 family metallo-hydrolase [Bacteroidetes bacterium]|nr:M20/M25/M40 family metallo-hydrolase [Bacteroidota bacterium]